MDSQLVALVTGANRGIGLETVKQLAEQGVHVLLASRDLQKGKAAAAPLIAAGLPVEPIELDIKRHDTFAKVAADIDSRFGKLDILVNNAAVNFDKPGEQNWEMGKWRETFEVNVFSVMALNEALLPVIEKSSAGKIINLSTILASLTLHTDPKSPIYGFLYPAYDVSKTALNAYTVHLAHLLKDSPISVTMVHPGWVKTDMGGEEAPMEIPDGAKSTVEVALATDKSFHGKFVHMGKELPW